ncbi:MAG TPA: tetratricopeptide repeat protein [Candidatus Hydrogenedens sp.]|nr:tetratricopeptide repeat protein [Candidatus Hydrogenedens sp.]HOL20820.1 tetratricopeptide repeat protein [Candidatus Hydrogenedens sp.]HPP59186.1 tetratricopeptide repeat protein [Candidatus Hydrogenedens sp.]
MGRRYREKDKHIDNNKNIKSENTKEGERKEKLQKSAGIQMQTAFYENLLSRKAVVYVLIPLWILAVVLALSPFVGDPAAPIKYLITAIFVFVLSAVTLFNTWVYEIKFQIKKTLLFITGGFLFFMFLSLLFAGNRMFALNEYYIWITLCFISLFVSVYVLNLKEIYWILTWVTIAIAISSIYGFFQKWGIDPFPWSTKDVEEYRGLPSTYANPNFAGHALLFAVITLIGLLCLYTRELWKSKTGENKKNFKTTLIKTLLYLICFLLTFTHLYFTRMRSARIALFMAIAFMLFYGLWGRKWEVKRILLWGGGLVVIAVIVIIIALGLLAKGYPHGSLPFDNSLNLRFNGYLGAVKMIMHKPILGYGPGNYRYENIPYWTKYEKLWFTIARKRNFHVHSDPLEAMVDAGIPGGIFYYGLILLGFISGLLLAKKYNDSSDGILGVIFSSVFLAFATDACFGFNIRVPVSSAMFFLFLGLTQVKSDDETLTLDIKKARTISTIIAVIFFLLMIQQFRYYSAEVQLQRAKGGIYWTKTYDSPQHAQSRERILERATQHAINGMSVKSWDARFPEITARIYMMRNDHQSALEYFDKALACDKYNPDLWTTRAQCCLNWIYYAQTSKQPLSMTVEKILDEAELSVSNAIKYCELYPDAYEGMARSLFFRTAYIKMSDEEKKEIMQNLVKYADKALENGLKESLPLFQIMIQAYQTLKDYDNSSKIIQRALAIDPANVELWSRYAQIMKQKNYPDEYLTFLEKNFARFKKDAKKMAPTLSQIALMIYQEKLRKTNNSKEATGILIETLKLNPHDLSTWGAVIQTFPAEQRLEQLQKLMLNFKNNQDIPEFITRLNKSQEEIDWLNLSRDVIASIEKDTQQKEPFKTIVLRYAWIAEVSFYVNTKREFDEKPELYANLATIYQKLRFDERALTCFPFASKSTNKTTQMRVMYSWAEILYKKQQYAQAEEKLQSALQVDPNNTQARALLIQTLAQQKKIAEAKFEYQSLKQSLPPNSSTVKSLEQFLAPFLNKQEQ